MIWDLFLSSLLLSVVLVGIHAHFGREIIKRGIIFADIAVAQFSALGYALSLVLMHGEGAFVLTLLFSLFASLLIAFSQRLKEYAEAFVGLLYALGVSGVVLLLTHSPHGMEEIRKLTAGDVLLVPFSGVLKSALLYAVIGLLLYLRARLEGILKELSFFVLFSLTLASSVSLVGVLVVFALLLGPAIVSLLFQKGIVFAWVYGTLINLVAVAVSFNIDLPTGYSIVFLQALAGMFAFIIKALR
ncbi:MAG: metal ABC transporter permease [Aquificaceae bacterium]|nr:metal ABC transporter permease [Aquificaceae bacterium]MDW8423012.1 metal ABC transporter permease [Aquificaceae bacterium]